MSLYLSKNALDLMINKTEQSLTAVYKILDHCDE